MIKLNDNNSYQPKFCANIKSPQLNLCRDDFFIKIKGYGKNENWADAMIKVTDDAADMIQKNVKADTVLKSVAAGINWANQLTEDIDKILKSGVLRTTRTNWNGSYDKDLFTQYNQGRYSMYKDRLDEIAQHPLNKLDNKLGMSRPYQYIDIWHGQPDLINNALDYVFNLFDKVIPQLVDHEITSESLATLNNTVAKIRWVLAHATPWLRGSDAISNSFMRAIYKSAGVKTYPPKNGISFDMEAYCTNLEDYQKNFPDFFEKPPKIIK